MPKYWHELQGGTWTTIDLAENHETLVANEAEDRLRRLAMSGDLEFVADPETAANGFTAINAAIAGAASKFTQTVTFTLQTAAGEVHTWYTGTRTIGIADTSSAGTAAIADTATATTLKFVAGVGTVTVEYTGTWAAAETATLTLTDGNVLGVEPGDATFVDTIADDS